ncbi:MAG: 16S rRNA (adenine(1518)-N(6)/adenine(1519)-N(6))-dimethyltransferase RsmA [Patescibacteria group bacterium]
MYEPKKELGQNFLEDFTVINKFIQHLDIQPNDTIVEIGPGLGAVTEKLVQNIFDQKNQLYAVEIDDRFTAKLGEMYLEDMNVHIILSDILEWLPKFEPKGSYKIIGSLPYYITTKIIHTILEKDQLAERVVILIQKEVAEKIESRAPDSTFISAYVQSFYNVEMIQIVPKSLFSPEPQVDGFIIKFTKKADSPLNSDFKKYKGFLRRAYSNPRKMLNKVFSNEECTLGNIDPAKRAQDYDAPDWLSMFNKLKERLPEE